MNLEPEIVVGLDLCGNPNTGDTKSILFALNFSKKMGQRVSVHLPEVRTYLTMFKQWQYDVLILQKIAMRACTIKPGIL